MNAPLSRYLTQFSAPPAVRAVEVVSPFEPRIELTVQEFDARLDAAAAAARSEAEAKSKAAIDALAATHECAMTDTLAAARAEWILTEAETIATQMAVAATELREMIADRVVRVLRPIMSESLVARAMRELSEALDKLLADPTRPTLSVKGPADLIAALRDRHRGTAVEWIVADKPEVEVVADATHIETRLGAALADLAATES